jgi:hypothetical protein
MPDEAPNNALQPLAFKPREAAKILNRSDSWLAKQRCTGTGPDYLKLSGHTVLYTREALEAWLAKQPRCTSTSQYVKEGSR